MWALAIVGLLEGVRNVSLNTGVDPTYWDWLDIAVLWLDERLRGEGHGTRLMRVAEDEAMRRGCVHSYLSTLSFQARGFYEGLGYRVIGRLDDYPPGHVKYWLRKDLGQSRP